jgi:hypothetical protein
LETTAVRLTAVVIEEELDTIVDDVPESKIPVDKIDDIEATEYKDVGLIGDVDTPTLLDNKDPNGPDPYG